MDYLDRMVGNNQGLKSHTGNSLQKNLVLEAKKVYHKIAAVDGYEEVAVVVVAVVQGIRIRFRMLIAGNTVADSSAVAGLDMVEAVDMKAAHEAEVLELRMVMVETMAGC
jgi:hypothetical protein